MRKIDTPKIIGCLLGAVLICSLTACGQPVTQQTVPPDQSQEVQTSSQSQPPQAPQSSEVASGLCQASQAPQSGTGVSEPEAAPSTDTVPESEDHVMVIYFSATGNTKAVAEVIAVATDGELVEIVPEVPYTSADLDWTKSDSRSGKEHEDSSIRPAIKGGVKDISGYDTVFIGYPLWWGEAPNIVWNFVESSNLSGKTVIPFATSSSSGLGSSGKTLESFAPDANWLDGQRFRSGAPEAEVQSWVSGLNI